MPLRTGSGLRRLSEAKRPPAPLSQGRAAQGRPVSAQQKPQLELVILLLLWLRVKDGWIVKGDAATVEADRKPQVEREGG